MLELLASGVLATLAVVVGVLVLFGGGERAPSSRVARGSAAAHPRIDPALSITLGVFARRQRGRDRIPVGDYADLVDVSLLKPGEDRSLSRRVDLGGSDRAYLWPMRHGVCYGSSPVGGGCVPTARIARRGMEIAMVSEVDPRTARYVSARVLGLARNGIGRVRLVLAGGGHVDLGVRDNAFYAGGLHEPPVLVHWTEHGTRHAIGVGTLTPTQIAALRAR